MSKNGTQIDPQSDPQNGTQNDPYRNPQNDIKEMLSTYGILGLLSDSGPNINHHIGGQVDHNIDPHVLSKSFVI